MATGFPLKYAEISEFSETNANSFPVNTEINL